MQTEPTLRPSDSLRNVRYEIRGKLAHRAHGLERLGYEIISLNIGNPAAFGFRTPETMRLAMIENLQNAEGYCHQKGIFPAREAVVMQQQGLVQALGSLAETVHEEYGIATSFTRPHGDWDAEEDRDTAIFQIAREAAVNAARHGRPPVLISLQRSPADIHLSVEDRGGGLATNGHAPREGVGIRMMHERAARIGAELTLESAPGTRTVVSLHVPAAR